MILECHSCGNDVESTPASSSNRNEQMQPADAAETMLLIISMQNQLADAERRERRIRAFQDPGSDDEAIKDLDWKWNPDAREWLHVTGVAVFRYGAHWAWNGQRYGLVYDAMNAAVPGSV